MTPRHIRMVWVAMRRLLLLACSERKRPDPGRIPAIERYDGPAYRVLRRYMRTEPREVLDVYILSAQFGLIRGDEPIQAYNRRMTPQRARELRGTTAANLQKLDLGRRYQHVFLHAGAMYREIFSSLDLNGLPQERLMASTGGQGVQLTHLKSWLYQGSEALYSPEPSDSYETVPVQFRLKGTGYKISQAEAIAVARSAMKNGFLKGLRATAWYVLVDDQRIPPKWLVSQLTGVPVSDFHSMEARRVLAQLGLTARQV